MTRSPESRSPQGSEDRGHGQWGYLFSDFYRSSILSQKLLNHLWPISTQLLNGIFPPLRLKLQRMNIMYCSVGCYSTAQQFYSFTAGTIPKELHHDAKTLFSKVKALQSKPNQRDKLKSSYGTWALIHDNHNFVYAICTIADYPERHVFCLIDEIKKISKEAVTSENCKTGKSLEEYFKRHSSEIDKVCERYESLRKIDKVWQAKNEVQGLKSELRTGISKMLQNKDELIEMEEKSVKMKSFAKEFAENATVLEQMTFWAKWKTYFMIGSIAAGLLLVSGLIIYSRVH